MGQKVLGTLVRLNDSVLIIEQTDSPAMSVARTRKIPYIIGDVRDFETLKKAGIENAKE
ncbi:NAD-binding protein [Desulfococcaceae bacterium HSG9]|nr:NAD-binding protein [Desulfococcaceae bacterium HSG9]